MRIKEVNKYMCKALHTQQKKGNIPPSINVPSNYNGVDVDNLNRSKRHKDKKNNLSMNKRQKKLSMYITKYISKNEEAFTHLAWHCSRDISALFTNINMEDIQGTDLENQLSYNSDKIKVIENEYFNLYVLCFDLPLKTFNGINTINQNLYDKLTEKSKKQKIYDNLAY